ncbi:MAG: UbiD family decarboxylase, partial [Deltaproteobacteria bacterium]
NVKGKTKMFQDLREWIDVAKELGELIVIEDCDTNEFGPISQITARNKGPAILHRRVKGYDPGFGVITNLMANTRTFNMTFGFPVDYTLKETVEALSDKASEWSECAPDYPPTVVETGPIFDNIVEGENIDLHIFPVPQWHKLDGGPYIGTADAVITKDPDTGLVNLGTYRSQLLDDKNVGVMISQGHHGRIQMLKYFEKGEPCPVAIVYGCDPLTFAIAAQETPQDVPELNYIGAIKGESVPVVTGKVTGLPIPAGSEIAVEGFFYPGRERPEGPFGEWPGYYAGGVMERPFLKPEAVYYRNEAILTGCPPAPASYGDTVYFRSVWRSALIYSELRCANVPGVKGVWCPPFGGNRHFVIVSIEQLYDGHAVQAGIVATQTRASAMQGRYTVVVDEDIDIYDTEQVLWAMSTRSYPAEMDIIKKTWSSDTDPTIRKPSPTRTTSRAIIYAVRPYEWRDEFPKVCLASEEVRKQTFDKWKHLLKERWQVA